MWPLPVTEDCERCGFAEMSAVRLLRLGLVARLLGCREPPHRVSSPSMEDCGSVQRPVSLLRRLLRWLCC